MLFVDDAAPETGVFARDAKRELARVLPDAAPIPIGTEHVVFRSFYFIRRPYGRVEGPPKLEAIVRGGQRAGDFQLTRFGRRACPIGERDLVGARNPGRRAPTRARHAPRGQRRDVRPLLELQGRSGARPVLDAQACGRHAMMVRFVGRSLVRPRRSSLVCGARARAARALGYWSSSFAEDGAGECWSLFRVSLRRRSRRSRFCARPLCCRAGAS